MFDETDVDRRAREGFAAIVNFGKLGGPDSMDFPLMSALKGALKRLHFPLEVVPMCVRWYVAYLLSLRQPEEMMLERGIELDHSTVHRWAIKLLLVLEKAFRKRRRTVLKSWRMDVDQRPVEIPLPSR
jgi:hypothetical protein